MTPVLANSFGISGIQLIAQILIFLIVFAILNKFAFGPVMNLLLARRQRIEEAEANYAKTKENLATAESQAKSIVAGADEQAGRLIKEAQDVAAAAAEKKRQEAVAEAASIIAKAREAGALEREQAMSALKRDFGRLVIDTTSKVTGKVLGPDDHSRINQETASQIAG